MILDAIQLNFTIGDIEGNKAKIVAAIRRSTAELILFSELAITGYPPQDLLLDPDFIAAAERALQEIALETKGRCVVVGLPRRNPSGSGKPLYNSAAILIDGALVCYKDKTLLPTYDVFDEARFFEPGSIQPVFTYLGRRIGVLICEDCWQHAGKVSYTNYARDPVLELAEQRVDLLLNLSASPYYYKRPDLRLAVFQACAKTLQCPVVLCNQVGANDQLVFDGHSFYLNEQGELVTCARGFVEADVSIDLTQTHPCPIIKQPIANLYDALVLGVRDYFFKQRLTKAILGLSGGIDSALVACIAVDALGSANVKAFNLPSRFSSPGSYADSLVLAKQLGIELEQISIDPLFQQYLDQLGPDLSDLTMQNIQARIRGMILMAKSNNDGAILLNTSNKSEMAMGYGTLYGDMAGGLGVLLDVAKQYVYELAKHTGKISSAILEKAPSAELKPNQIDLDTLPPYEILDPIIEAYIEEGKPPAEIAIQIQQPLSFVEEIIHKIHLNEYKRRQAPLAIRVTQKAFNSGRVVPIVQRWK